MLTSTINCFSPSTSMAPGLCPDTLLSLLSSNGNGRLFGLRACSGRSLPRWSFPRCSLPRRSLPALSFHSGLFLGGLFPNIGSSSRVGVHLVVSALFLNLGTGGAVCIARQDRLIGATMASAGGVAPPGVHCLGAAAGGSGAGSGAGTGASSPLSGADRNA